MRLYKLWFDCVGGEEFTEILAANSLTDEQAKKYIIAYMRKNEDKYFDESDITAFEYTQIKEIKALNNHKYVIKLFKKEGLLYAWLNPARFGRVD